MKNKIFKYAIALGILVSLGSCSFLDENNRGNMVADDFYKNEDQLKMAAPGIALQFNGAFNQTWGATYAGDDMTSKNSGNKIGFHAVDVFEVNSSNDRIVNWWSYFYKTIKTCNSLIISTQNNKVGSRGNEKQYIAIAHFYRAMSYFFLTRTWGEVPLVLDMVAQNDRKNAKVEEIYKQIVADMMIAERDLPVKWDGSYNQEGVNIFPTQGAAKSALANIYLTMAGWPLKQTDKYALAAEKAKEVIDNSNTYGYMLEDINQLWRKRFTKETVFGCYYNVDIAGWSWENGSQMGPCAFVADEEAGWEDGFAELGFYNEFPEGPRKDATFQKEYFKYKKDDKTKYDVLNYTQLAVKHPFYWKYRFDNYDEAKHKTLNWWGSATVPVIRYAEVLLTYAEAKAKNSGVDASAYDAINQVRTRAGLPNLAAGLSAEEFAAAVVTERGWEFAGPEPAARWFDLLRTETLGKAMAKRNLTEPEDYRIKPENMPNDQTHSGYWMPIPENK